VSLAPMVQEDDWAAAGSCQLTADRSLQGRRRPDFFYLTDFT
jgi:hypothetical protein